MSHARGYPWGQLWSLSWLCPLPTSPAPPAPPDRGWTRGRKGPGGVQAQQEQNHLCVINPVLSTHPRSVSVPASVASAPPRGSHGSSVPGDQVSGPRDGCYGNSAH